MTCPDGVLADADAVLTTVPPPAPENIANAIASYLRPGPPGIESIDFDLNQFTSRMG